MMLGLGSASAAADFGYANGPDPAISVDPGDGTVAVSLPGLTFDRSSNCRLVVSRSVGAGPLVEEGQFRAYIMDDANLATFLSSFAPPLAPGDTIVLDLVGCDDVPADADSVTVTVTASAKLVPEAPLRSSSSLWGPVSVLAMLTLITATMVRRQRR